MGTSEMSAYALGASSAPPVCTFLIVRASNSSTVPDNYIFRAL